LLGGVFDASGDAFTGGLRGQGYKLDCRFNQYRADDIERDIGGDISAAGEGEGGD
jgi:hypothetical protein